MQEYLADVGREMFRKSKSIRRDFRKHNLTSGENLEDIVREFLVHHLPKRFGIKSGLVISHDDKFSNQADLLIVDEQNNAPLYPDLENQIWPVESIYALIEVKAKLDGRSLADSVAKGRRFKSLQRRFYETRTPVRHIDSSLFVIWAFESVEPETIKGHLVDQLSDVPVDEQPDLILVLGEVVAKCGSYLQIARLGEPISQHRAELMSRHSGDLSGLIREAAEVDHLRDYSLLVWTMWLDSWLRQAGARIADPFSYLPPGYIYGERI